MNEQIKLTMTDEMKMAAALLRHDYQRQGKKIRIIGGYETDEAREHYILVFWADKLRFQAFKKFQ